MIRFLGMALRWVAGWCFYVAVVLLAGAAAGAASHVVFGLLFLDPFDPGYLAAFGFFNGLKYGGVWAGGLAIVLCVMRARREYMARAGEEDASQA